MKSIRYILALAFACNSNDSFLGTDGGNIYPQKSDSIQMIREDISIDLEKSGGVVKCKFWFINRGKSEIVHVGFPDAQINPASYTEPAKDFKAWVNGKSVEVKKDSLVEILDSADTLKNSWYHWEVDFPKNDTVLVENRYFGIWGGSYCEKAFTYIIGTGNKWSGPIGKGRVVFHHDKLLSSYFIGKGIWSDSEDLKPDYNEDSAVYEFNDYTPKENERLSLWFSSYWGNSDSLSCPGFFIRIDSLPHKREMINELYARHGHIFKSKKIQAKFESKKWYERKKELKLEELPRDVQVYIGNLKGGIDKMFQSEKK